MTRPSDRMRLLLEEQPDVVFEIFSSILAWLHNDPEGRELLRRELEATSCT